MKALVPKGPISPESSTAKSRPKLKLPIWPVTWPPMSDWGRRVM